MTENHEPTMTVEKRLATMGEDLQALRVLSGRHETQIQGIADVLQGIAEVQGEHGQSLEEHGKRLQSLHVLCEHHDEQIQRIAEVQTAHGVKLEQHSTLLEEHGKLLREIKSELGGVKGALAPLRDIHDFVKRIAGDHESRISALENRPGA